MKLSLISMKNYKIPYYLYYFTQKGTLCQEFTVQFYAKSKFFRLKIKAGKTNVFPAGILNYNYRLIVVVKV